MRRNIANTRYRSQSICVTNTMAGNSGGSGLATVSASSSPLRSPHYGSYDTRSESTCSSPSGRRESLVKPTWQNIRPGQIPVKTLEKINGITSDSDNDEGEGGRRPSILMYAAGSSNGGAYGVTQKSPKSPNNSAEQHGQGQSSLIQQQQSSSVLVEQQQSHPNQQHRSTSARKHSSSNLGQLTRKGSLVVHRDSLSHGSSRSRQSIDATNSAATATSSLAPKSPSRSLVRVLSDNRTTFYGSDDDMDYNFMSKPL
ncbi:uncharacterized protein LOC142233397 [Haematobia irritans]|uniref:uncharacterized protein LOC142233397 n=1 Tax=Haematobia irritans TaxID=7368 RepID=UPI003F4FF28B